MQRLIIHLDFSQALHTNQAEAVLSCDVTKLYVPVRMMTE